MDGYHYISQKQKVRKTLRLVDADELMEHIWRDRLDSRELIAQMIETAPTVKEIPTKIPIETFERLLEIAGDAKPHIERDKEIELKLCPCSCGGEMEIKKVAQDGGMDGTYWDWVVTCKKCGLTRIYAADGFYGRKYMTFKEVIDDWNRNKIKSL